MTDSVKTIERNAFPGRNARHRRDEKSFAGNTSFHSWYKKTSGNLNTVILSHPEIIPNLAWTSLEDLILLHQNYRHPHQKSYRSYENGLPQEGPEKTQKQYSFDFMEPLPSVPVTFQDSRSQDDSFLA